MVDLPQLFWQNHGAHDSLSQILEVHQIFGTNMTRDSTVPSWLAPSGFCWCHRFSETEKDVENQGFPRENDRQMVKTCDSDRHGMDDRTTHIILLGYVCWVYTHLSISIYIYPVYVCIYINTIYIYIMYIPCIHIYNMYPIIVELTMAHMFFWNSRLHAGGLWSQGRLSVPTALRDSAASS